MTIKATFIGTDSLGYENGKEYQLLIPNSKSVTIQRMDRTGRCPYASLSAFLNNWNKIEIINREHKK
jgi:hypothetical protein